MAKPVYPNNVHSVEALPLSFHFVRQKSTMKGHATQALLCLCTVAMLSRALHQSALLALQDMTSTAFGDDIIVDYLASSFAAMRDMGPAVYRPFMQARPNIWPQRAGLFCMHTPVLSVCRSCPALSIAVLDVQLSQGPGPAGCILVWDREGRLRAQDYLQWSLLSRIVAKQIASRCEPASPIRAGMRA